MVTTKQRTEVIYTSMYNNSIGEYFPPIQVYTVSDTHSQTHTCTLANTHTHTHTHTHSHIHMHTHTHTHTLTLTHTHAHVAWTQKLKTNIHYQLW